MRPQIGGHHDALSRTFRPRRWIGRTPPASDQEAAWRVLSMLADSRLGCGMVGPRRRAPVGGEAHMPSAITKAIARQIPVINRVDFCTKFQMRGRFAMRYVEIGWGRLAQEYNI